MGKITELFNLTDKIAIITGGYGHLGTAMVNVLLECNANVVVAGRNKEKYQSVFKSKLNPPNLYFEKIDITNTKSIDICFNTIYNKFGQIDILINNAHSPKGSSQGNISDEDWSYTMEGVVGSVHKTIRTIIPFMKKQNSGKIINIASMYGIVSPDFNSLYKGHNCEKFTNPPHYGAAKAAMIQLTKYYAVLLGEFNIQVNAIAPGPFPNPSVQKENSTFIERLKHKNPLHKIGKPEDLSGVVALLSSAASDFITGQTIQVDGGWTIW